MRRHFARALLATLLLASCKGDSTTPRAPEPLHVLTASARPHELLQAYIRGATVPATELTGKFGGQHVPVSRMDDTTVALIVPALTAGSHQLAIDMGVKTYAATVQVLAAVPLPSPEMHIDSTLASIEASTEALEERMLSSATRPPGVDSAAFMQQLESLRATLGEVKTQWAAASAADRQAVVAILTTNAALFGLNGSESSFATMASQVLFSGAADCDRVSPFLVTTNREAKQLWVTLAVVGVVSWGASPAGKLLGVAVSALIVKKFILAKQEQIWQHLIAPCVAALLDESSESNVAGAALVAATAAPPIFIGGESRAVAINAEFRSIVAADASATGPIGVIVALFSEFRSIWRDLVSLIPLLEAPAPQLPAVPAKREKHPVPAAQLALGSVSPSGVTGTASSSGTDWMLRLDKPGFGKDINVTFDVHFTPTGMPTQTRARSGVLQPKVYPVATVTVPATATVARQGTHELEAVVRDSMQRVLTGRTLFWSSSATNIATVNSSSGVVTGVATGNAIVSVRATGTVNDTVRATTTVSVVDHKVVIAPKSVSVEAGKTQQFSATVTGTTNSAVTWSATGGTVSSEGSYSAGTATGTFRAIVTTAATPARADTATITVTAPDSTAIYTAAVLGMWRVSNVIGGGSGSYPAELFDQIHSGNNRIMTYYTQPSVINGQKHCPSGPAPASGFCEYGAYWYISKVNGKYYLYDVGFWHPGYNGETRDPLTMPLSGFTTYSNFSGQPSRTFTR